MPETELTRIQHEAVPRLPLTPRALQKPLTTLHSSLYTGSIGRYTMEEPAYILKPQSMKLFYRNENLSQSLETRVHVSRSYSRRSCVGEV